MNMLRYQQNLVSHLVSHTSTEGWSATGCRRSSCFAPAGYPCNPSLSFVTPGAAEEARLVQARGRRDSNNDLEDCITEECRRTAERIAGWWTTESPRASNRLTSDRMLCPARPAESSCRMPRDIRSRFDTRAGHHRLMMFATFPQLGRNHGSLGPPSHYGTAIGTTSRPVFRR